MNNVNLQGLRTFIYLVVRMESGYHCSRSAPTPFLSRTTIKHEVLTWLYEDPLFLNPKRKVCQPDCPEQASVKESRKHTSSTMLSERTESQNFMKAL